MYHNKELYYYTAARTIYHGFADKCFVQRGLYRSCYCDTIGRYGTIYLFVGTKWWYGCYSHRSCCRYIHRNGNRC